MSNNYKPIGDYIQLVDERNKGLKITTLLGLSISKQFIKSVANVIGTDMENYKIIRKNQFACSTMQVRRDKKMPLALYTENEPAIISQAYPIFEIIDTTLLLPEYLMMWFTRSEFDRQACFHAVGGVRGSLEWEDFCDMQLPIPSLAQQQKIVQEYQTVQNRIALNNQLIAKLEETAQTIYKQWFVEGIDLENLPEGWKYGVIKDICNYSTKRITISNLNLNNYISTENMLQDRMGVTSANSLPIASTATYFEIDNILISNIRPYLKKIWFANFEGGCSNDVLCFVTKKGIPPLYLYQVLESDVFFDYMMSGSKGTKMPRGDKDWIMNYEIIIPSNELLDKFNKISKVLQQAFQRNRIENQKLEELKELLLAKMTRVESELETVES